MNSANLKSSADHENPPIELSMRNFMEHLSNEHICGKSEAVNDGVQTNLRVIGCKTEDCTDLGEFVSVSGIKIEPEEKVRMFNIEFVVFHHKRV